MGDIHRLLIEHGVETVRRMDLDRGTVEAAASYLGTEDDAIGVAYAGWAQAALPHRKQPDDAHWEIRTDRVSLLVMPGMKSVPGKDAAWAGVPYGARARLILLYLQTQALRNNSREVELGASLRDWMNRMGVPVGGESARAIREQADRISRCRMSFEICGKDGRARGLINQNLVDGALFLEPDDRQGALSLERTRLGEVFFEQLKRHPLPIEEKAVSQLRNNSMAIDVYLWLAYRLHALPGPTNISWGALKQQFGKGMNRLDHFRTHFRGVLGLATAVYPEASVEETDRGVRLKPSRPPVAQKVVHVPAVPRRP